MIISTTREEIRQFRDNLYVYINFKDYYPTTFETGTSEEDLVYLKHYESPKLYHHFEQLTLDHYIDHIRENRKSIYDLHEKNFQDFALKETASFSMKPEHEPFGKLYLKRTRMFAIASRDDLTWEGQPITDPTEKERKRLEMNSYHFSVKLYDWCLATEEQIVSLLGSKIKNKETKLSVMNQDTLLAVEMAYNRLGDQMKIGWLNLANAHNVGGAYNRSVGSQEENTITYSTAAVSLTLHADPLPDNIHQWINQNQDNYMFPIKYRKNHHIPPGGVYFCKTKLLNTKDYIDCYMIAMASADFREITPYRKEAESHQFEVNSEIYKRRILIDLEAVCLTAIKHDIDCLILGASGCGAFLHDAKIESMLWHQVLNKYSCYFKEIIFAIRDKTNGYNIRSFEMEFSENKSYN